MSKLVLNTIPQITRAIQDLYEQVEALKKTEPEVAAPVEEPKRGRKRKIDEVPAWASPGIQTDEV